MSWFKRIFSKSRSRNPPATVEAIAAYESDSGIHLPESLRRFYLETNGHDLRYRREAHAFRLMSLEEVRKLDSFWDQSNLAPLFRAYSMRCFWSDENSNYAGVFCGGPFDGRVFYFDHEGDADYSPLFKSVDSFVAHNERLIERNCLVVDFEDGGMSEEKLQAEVSRFPEFSYVDPFEEVGWHSMPVELRCSAESYSKAELAAFEDCKRRLGTKAWNSDGERDFLVYSLARFVPPDRISVLVPYLEEDHMWLPSIVARIVALQECREAISHFVTLALRGNRNCQGCGQQILAKMIFQDPSLKSLIETEYATQGGDFEQITRDLKALERSPALVYQW